MGPALGLKGRNRGQVLESDAPVSVPSWTLIGDVNLEKSLPLS